MTSTLHTLLHNLMVPGRSDRARRPRLHETPSQLHGCDLRSASVEVRGVPPHAPKPKSLSRLAPDRWADGSRPPRTAARPCLSAPGNTNWLGLSVHCPSSRCLAWALSAVRQDHHLAASRRRPQPWACSTWSVRSGGTGGTPSSSVWLQTSSRRMGLPRVGQTLLLEHSPR